ncbi:protein kinase [bacterium]|nr:protein kinase [bacterium]
MFADRPFHLRPDFMNEMHMSSSCPKCGYVFHDPEARFETTRPVGSGTDSERTCPQCGEELEIDFLQTTALAHLLESDLAGTRVSHFLLARKLGAGSFGEVWLAEDQTLARKVAIKLPLIQGLGEAFPLNEARTAASLNHNNIVRVLEVGNDGQQVFIASEYIEGMTLRDRLSAGKLTTPQILELLIAISEALDYAHQAGVIHRDVKPGNILLNQEGRPFITDFGIARRVDGDYTISQEGQILGTVRYMSPEQASGKSSELTCRTDIYAIGVMLFEMLTGDLPFRGTSQAILHQKTIADAPSPRLLNPQTSRDLETICLKCLEREPLRRYATAREVADELRRVQRGEPILARPVTRLERVVRWCQRHPATAALLTSLLLSLSLGLSGVTYFWLRAEDRGASARRALYYSWMNLAAVHLTNGDYTGVQQILSRVTDDPQMNALRGMEWNYYDSVTAPLNQVANQGDVVLDVALSRDGDLCASVAQGQGIQVWDSNSGELVRTLRVDDVAFHSIDFSPTAAFLAAGARDGYVRLWQPAMHDRSLQQMEHGPPVKLVRFSPNGDRLLSVGASGAVRLWNIPDGQRIAEVPTGKGSDVRDARFSPDGRTLYVATRNGQIREWNLDRLPQAPALTREWTLTNTLECMAVSDDGKILISGNYDGELTIDFLTGDEDFTYRSIWGRIDDLEFLKDSHTVLVTASDGETQMFDLQSRHEFRSVHTHGFSYGMLARSANGASFAVGSGNGVVTRVTIDDILRPQILWQEHAVRKLAIFPDTHELLAIDDRGLIRLWQPTQMQPTPFLPELDGRFRRMSLNADGTLIALADTAGTIEIWDRLQKTLVHKITLPGTHATVVQFADDGSSLAIGTRKNQVLVFASDNWNQARYTTEPTTDAINTLAFSSDNQTLAVARDGNTVELLSLKSEKVSGPSIKLPAEPTALLFCDEFHLLAMATSTGEIHLWNLQTRRPQMFFKGHTGRINTMAQLANQPVLISGGRDRLLKLWDMNTGELITPLSGHARQVFTIAVATDGRTLYSGGLDGDIRIWPSRRKE